MPEGSVLQLRPDERLKSDFVDAARLSNSTPSEALRARIAGYVRDARKREAHRQSLIVAASPEAATMMDELAQLQAWAFD